MSENKKLLSYTDLLTQLKESGEQNHLLLGNGFNMSVGVVTSYKNIFKEMICISPHYKKIENLCERKNFDLEEVIKKLQDLQNEINDNEDEKIFLREFIEMKFKLDFMKALYKLIHKRFNKIHKNKKLKNDIWTLFKNFNRYFTLNFDPLLYLILMKFKNTPNNESIAYKKNSLVLDLDEFSEDTLRSKITELHKKGSFTTALGEESHKTVEMKNANKREFNITFKRYFQDEINRNKWSSKNIELSINHFLNQEDGKYNIEVNDGFQESLLFNDQNNSQNLFFLHGCLHIVSDSDGNVIRKVKQTEIKSLFDHIEELVLYGENETICVLSGTSSQKEKQINENSYLKKCYKEFGKISGNVVVLGFSASENDSHIIFQLNRNEIKNLYFGTSVKEYKKTKETLKEFLPNKNIIFFDYNSITFSKTNLSD